LTILGIILFLRLGYVIGQGGLAMTLTVLALSASLAFVTSISLSAIATNIRVKGGGVYYLISRSLGSEFGGALGIVLFVAQSVSIAFYCIGFAEAVTPLTGLPVRWLACMAAVVLFGLAWLGADWATRMQYAVFGILALALGSVFWGAAGAWDVQQVRANWGHPQGGDSFWILFALFFPAVTGFTQGANMSGDLRDPEISLPRGVLSSVIVSTVLYAVVAVLLAGSLSGRTLLDSTSMRQAARWDTVVDAGLIAAALSSALASFLGAPRILQSLARDRIFPFLLPFAHGSGPSDNPRRGLLLSAGITALTIGMGNLNLIAPIVSMFFLISYGLLNYATYIEASGASPSFRPRFRWFHAQLSLLGALGCLGAMLAIDPIAGALAIVVLFGIQQVLQRQTSMTRWADGRRSYLFQRVRQALLAMEGEPEHSRDWRPRLVTLSKDPARRDELLRFGAWLEAGSGLNTIVRVLVGDPDDLGEESERIERELRDQVEASGFEAFTRVLVAPTLSVGVQSLLQTYGVGPLRANTVLLNWMEPNVHTDEPLDERQYGDQLRLSMRLGCNVVVLHGTRLDWHRLSIQPAKERRIDVLWQEDASSRLLLLLAYLITRNDEWRGSRIRVLTPRNKRGREKTRAALVETLRQARIEADVEVVVDPDADALATWCGDAALVVLPMQLRGKQPLDPFGNRLDGLLQKLPLTVLVRAAEDIDLCAEPDEGEHSEVTAALDQASDAVVRARQAEKAAREAHLTAERKRQEMQKVPLLEEEKDAGVDKRQREAEEATRNAEELERAARKARHQARHAAANARQRSSRSSQVIQEKARSLEQKASVEDSSGTEQQTETAPSSTGASRD
jgi:amino acid transporter